MSHVQALLKTSQFHLVVCLGVPLQWIQVVCGETAECTSKNFPCVGLPDMGITTVLRAPYGVTPGAGPISYPPNQNNYWFIPLLLHWRCHWLWSSRCIRLHSSSLGCSLWSWWCRWWWWWCQCSHGPHTSQQLGQVPCPHTRYCLFKKSPPICHHLMALCNSPDSWKQVSTVLIDLFDTRKM